MRSILLHPLFRLILVALAITALMWIAPPEPMGF